MKISVLTPTYNRDKFLNRIYKSLIENLNYGIDIEWLIMDDGSTDNTKQCVEKMQDDYIKDNSIENKNVLEIRYFFQENQGKMTAINNLVEKSTGDFIVDCDSDDYFSKDAFKIILDTYESNKNNLKDIYAFCFLKYDTNGKNMGDNFKNKETTMFDLYFKEGETGEKALVFLADIRKKYKHRLENGEKFVTEARLYHEMDLDYKMICVNRPIMVCEYQDNGYTKNIMTQFKMYPFGYYEYFREILSRDMKGVLKNKKKYAIKHFLLFRILTIYKRVFTKQNILYIVFGIITTLINIGISAFLFKYLNVEGNISSFIGIVFAILFAYFSNRKFVFESQANSFKEYGVEFVKFFGGRIFSMILEVVGVFLLFSVCKIDYVVTKLVMTIIVVILNYVLSKKYIFKK